MKITVKIVRGKNEISIESEDIDEIVRKLDEIKKITNKLEGIQTKETKETGDELPPEATEWTSEY